MNGEIGQLSRLTFREKVNVCWQKKLRDTYIGEGVPDVELSLGKSVVRRVSRRFAKQIILKYEWLGTMAATGYHYGIFFENYCAGVCCYAAGGGTGGVNSHKPFGVERRQLGVLARGANVHWSPSGANSRLVSVSCRLFSKDTQAKIVIAYSDTDGGEIGTIYQACNWAYIGAGASTTQYVSPEGRIMDQKLPSDLRRRHGGTRQHWRKKLLEDGWREQKSNPKHRYVKVLDKKERGLIKRVEAMRQMYPKRADD